MVQIGMGRFLDQPMVQREIEHSLDGLGHYYE